MLINPHTNLPVSTNLIGLEEPPKIKWEYRERYDNFQILLLHIPWKASIFVFRPNLEHEDLNEILFYPPEPEGENIISRHISIEPRKWYQRLSYQEFILRRGVTQDMLNRELKPLEVLPKFVMGNYVKQLEKIGTKMDLKEITIVISDYKCQIDKSQMMVNFDFLIAVYAIL